MEKRHDEENLVVNIQARMVLYPQIHQGITQRGRYKVRNLVFNQFAEKDKHDKQQSLSR
jgi:hypothetical protein